jgi:hypothetical protein
MAFGNRNCAAAIAFARVLAGATVVTTSAATLSTAIVLALAIMLGRRCTTAMALARVLGGATIVAGFATSLALALVHALAHMLLAAFRCVTCFLCNNTASLSASKNSGHSAEQQFVEISTFHTHSGISHKSSKSHIHPARNHGTHPAARYAAVGVSIQDVPNHRGLAMKSTLHVNVQGINQANASTYKSRSQQRTTPLYVPLWRNTLDYPSDNLARHQVVL